MNRLYFRRVIMASVLVLAILQIPMFVKAEEVKNKVAIQSELSGNTNDYQFTTKVTVNFLDKSLYNPGVKLSYKIYDAEMNPISVENARIDLEVKNGRTEAVLDIDLLEHGVQKGQNVIVVIDMVDETNIFWFGDNPYVEFERPIIRVNFNFWYEFKMIYIRLFKNQLPQLLINLFGFIVAAYLIRILYKKILLPMKQM